MAGNMNTSLSRCVRALVFIQPKQTTNLPISLQTLFTLASDHLPVTYNNQLNIKIIVASMRNPYDIMAFPEIDANILTYGFRPVSVKALAKAVSGELSPRGKLPVTIPGMYPYGHGLSY